MKVFQAAGSVRVGVTVMMMMMALLSSSSITTSSNSGVLVEAAGVRASGTNTKRNAQEATDEVLASFKQRNFLRDDFNKPIISMGGNADAPASNNITFSDPSTRTASSRFSSPYASTRATTVSLASENLIQLPSVFSAEAKYYQNGILTNLPPNPLFTTHSSSNVVIAKNTQGHLEWATRKDATTGTIASSLISVQLIDSPQLFAEVEPEDIDPFKLAEFDYGEGVEETPVASLRSNFNLTAELEATNKYNSKTQSQSNGFKYASTPTSRQGGCSSTKVIEVAIAYESEFCSFFGGSERANAVVQQTISETSEIFERQLCTKVELVHLEGYCSRSSDPYRNMFSRSVCDQNDDRSLVKQVQEYWVANRAHVKRDVMHLFHGVRDDTSTIGCAFRGALCSQTYGYGVDEITFGGNNNPKFWSMLFAHEMGHSSGATHECCDGYIMDTTLQVTCKNGCTSGSASFSPESVATIKFYMEQSQEFSCLNSRAGQTQFLAPPGGAPAPTPVNRPAPAPAPTRKQPLENKDNQKLGGDRGGAGGGPSMRRRQTLKGSAPIIIEPEK